MLYFDSVKLLEGVALSEMCDYSFGDQSGSFGNIFTSFMKDVNIINQEFVKKVFEIKTKRNYMTVFIDNIRLYNREIKEVKPQDKEYVKSLMKGNDLLKLCKKISDINFIIFTNLEDTPIDEYIFDYIPDNVLCISAVNAISYGGKVIPAPYGVQRQIDHNDDRINLLKNEMIRGSYIEDKLEHLLYVNHSDSTHVDRHGIKSLFYDKLWAKVQINKVEYEQFLKEVKKSKFVLCPRGNAIDCHRNWEVLYMRRVPVMKKYPYLEELFKNYPVLFVDDYSCVNEDLLNNNQDLFYQALNLKLDDLLLPNFFNNVVNHAINR